MWLFSVTLGTVNDLFRQIVEISHKTLMESTLNTRRSDGFASADEISDDHKRHRA